MKGKVLSLGERLSDLMKTNIVFNSLIGLFIVAELFALGALSYLGTFSRYISDDYCEAIIIRGESVLSGFLNIYLEGEFRGTNRFTKFLFLSLAEKIGSINIQLLPALLILIWLVGLVWSVNQIRKLAGIRLPFIFDLFIAGSVIFFTVWQAPNRFQIFLWRSGMATHFAPLVFMPLFAGLVLFKINSGKKPSLLISLLVFVAAFFVCGFSEPPAAVMIVVIILLLPVVWQWDDDAKRRSALNLFSYSLAGALLALIAMFFAPGNLSYGTASLAKLFVALGQTFRYTFNFLDDTFRTLPLSSLISFLIPFLVGFALIIKSEDRHLDSDYKRRLWLLLILVPLIQALLIAASFAPSAYGQSYPAERAQILGRFIMTAALMFEGSLLGVLAALYGKSLFRRQVLYSLSVLTLLILAFYPLRAGLILLTEVPVYSEWTSRWDVREAEIYEAIEAGEQDLVVSLLPSRDGVKEIDALTRHWVNGCAAEYYGINTIRSVPTNNK
ncbi:MAG TPA: DUF6056 family protein [Anaerolineales bacterium]|nr:DUF6056 family protein [Anaerolineales bacterium]